MLVATKKRKENIAEYILYMFQVEDLIRAFKFDTKKLDEFVTKQYAGSNVQQKEILAWYHNLSLMMVKEGLKEKGHLQFLVNLMNDLENFHLRILQENEQVEYIALFKTMAGIIQEFKSKTSQDTGDVVACINGLYMYLMLKLQKKQVSPETVQAMKGFGKLLSKLSALYNDFEQGKLEL